MSQVVTRYSEFEALQTNIVAISFGLDYWARAWMAETNAPFPVWLDPDRAAYQAYGLKSSAVQAWGVKNLKFYAKAVLRGEKLQGHRGDTHQLGGNFIVDSQGILRLVYPSRNPTDRPTIEAMLAVLSQIANKPQH